jgi:hypothetical protein
MLQPTEAPSFWASWKRSWSNFGGSSLSFSLLIHLGLVLLAGSIVIVTQLKEPDKVDFLPASSGGGSQSNTISQKVRSKSMARMRRQTPLERIAVIGDGTIQLPDVSSATIDSLPSAEQMLGSGSLGKGMGPGRGITLDSGLGKLDGMTFKPLMLFDMEIKDARKIAVIMDVSRSMTKHLPAVVKELDKIANHSVLILYFGCGIANAPGRLNDRVQAAKGEDFNAFWQVYQGSTELSDLMQMKPSEQRKLRYMPDFPMPLQEIYQKVANRPNTYFVEFNGINYAWTALLSKEVMEADTLYWFADFQDRIDEEQADQLRRKLKARKQKLYLHAADEGRYLQQAKEWLAEPLGGQLVQTKL